MIIFHFCGSVEMEEGETAFLGQVWKDELAMELRLAQVLPFLNTQQASS